jgi:hypothetical protein
LDDADNDDDEDEDDGGIIIMDVEDAVVTGVDNIAVAVLSS